MPTIEYPQVIFVPEKLPSVFTKICLAMFVASVSLSTQAQDVSADPLYGTGNLDAGFLPDPLTVEITPGGADTVDHLGDECVGYIAASQPDYDLNYQAGSSQLGIFVESDIDTTLIVNDPRGNWHCNDDAPNLDNANPGLFFNTPISGNYNIWVGTYEESASSESTILAITEFDQDQWSTLDGLKNADGGSLSIAGIDFGDNSSTWANDGECDDPRFEGDGMATTTIEDDLRSDANDCSEAYQAGTIQLIGSLGDVNIDFGDNTSEWANDGECDDSRFAGDGMASFLSDSHQFHDANDCRSMFSVGSISLANSAESIASSDALQRGSLSGGDSTRANESYVDSYTFTGTSGGSAVIDLRSSEFDTYLIVRSPSGLESVNDDYESSFSRSLVSMDLSESGTYEVLVSSYSSGETGSYTLEIQSDSVTVSSGDQQFSGSLASGDSTYSDGEYFDSYTYEGRPGEQITIDLQSNDFDTYLILQSPNGEAEANDDATGTNHSQIIAELSDLGTYEIFVTSFGPAETGDYELTITEAGVANNATIGNRDVVSLAIGESIQGNLQSGDSLSDEDRYQDSYVFSADAGDTVTVDMTSTAVDTYLSLITPSGESIENDDYNSSVDQSLLQLTLQESGRYRVIASSYSSEETGDYRLTLRSGSGSTVTNNIVSNSGAQIYGIFAGIADYEGTDSDLPLTDQDAERARDALIEGAGMNPNNAYTLLNSDATIGNFRNALNQIAASAGEEDTLVIFYSGHGGRVERSAGPDSRDPDGFDETMVLYDYNLLDDELADMLDQFTVGKVLLVMDSCFSGGFSKDIVSVPGRMGLFSSEEDVLSQVALKFQAGGYLSVFFEEALTEGYADIDDNGELTAIELSQYLHNRFRSDVKSSFGTNEYVRASGPQANYQQLVVDRGGVGPYNVLFTRQ